MDSFLQQFASMQGAPTLILCHDHADSDAIGAAYALSKYLGGKVGVPNRIAAHTQGLIEHLKLDVILHPNVSEYTYTLIVDTADPVQLGDCLPETYWVIDHHTSNTLIDHAQGSLYDPVSSTCQLVYRLFRQLN